MGHFLVVLVCWETGMQSIGGREMKLSGLALDLQKKKDNCV